MLTERVSKTIDRFGMVRPGDRVLIGLSGGPDSVALTHVLHTLREQSAIDMTLEVAHIHHGLRDAADTDEGFCRELAERIGVPFFSERVDVASLARRSKRSVEEQGRISRYELLSELAARRQCDRIALGHTRDDQAETVLMRLARGSGSRGLASMYPVVGPRIRPLMEIRRREILDYLDARGLAYRHDASNLDRRHTRNRVRLDVIPMLSRELNPRVVETLARSAEILRDEEDFLEAEARRAFASLAGYDDGDVQLSVATILELHPALRRRVVRLAVERVKGDRRNIGHRHVDEVLALLGPGKSGRETHLPGVVVARSFGEISLRCRSGREPRETGRNGYNRFEYRLAVPGRVPVRECKGLLAAHFVESTRAGHQPLAAAGNAVVVGVDDGPLELTLRSPRRSDRFRPLGAPGSKPLARYLMERKVAKEDRRHVPLVARARIRQDDEILWVVGHAISETARLAAGQKRLHLEWMSE